MFFRNIDFDLDKLQDHKNFDYTRTHPLLTCFNSFVLKTNDSFCMPNTSIILYMCNRELLYLKYPFKYCGKAMLMMSKIFKSFCWSVLTVSQLCLLYIITPCTELKCICFTPSYSSSKFHQDILIFKHFFAYTVG